MTQMLNKNNLNIARFGTADRPGMYDLNRIQILPDATIATDGDVAIRVSTCYEEETRVPSSRDKTFDPMSNEARPLYLDLFTAKEMANNLPKERTLTFLNHAFIGTDKFDKPVAFTTDLENETVTSLNRPVDNDKPFPDVAAFAQQFGTELAVISIDLELLIPLLTQLQAIVNTERPKIRNEQRQSSATIRLYTGADKPIRIDVKNSITGQTGVGILMPLMLDCPIAVPWPVTSSKDSETE